MATILDPLPPWSPQPVRNFLAHVESAIARSATIPDSMAALRSEIDARLVELAKISIASKSADEAALIAITIASLESRRRQLDDYTGGYYENTRSLMENAQNWAMHFSNIRLGLTTFLAGISWGMVGLQWDEYDPILAKSALSVWTAAVVLFGAFTWNTFAKEGKERRNLLILKGRAPFDGDDESLWNGWHFAALLIALAFAWLAVLVVPERCWSAGVLVGAFLCTACYWLGILLWPKARLFRDNWSRFIPDFAVIVATGAFAFLLAAWPVAASKAELLQAVRDSVNTLSNSIHSLPSEGNRAEEIRGVIGNLQDLKHQIERLDRSDPKSDPPTQ